MSNRHRDELLMAAQKGAIEATKRERARCLWILDRMVQQCSAGLEDKLMPAAQLQLVKLRFELTKTICKAARTLVLSGIRPPEATATPAPGHPEPPPAPPSEIVVP